MCNWQDVKPWICTNKIYIPKRENKNAKINKNVSVATEIIFCFGFFDFFDSKNNVFVALGFVGCAIFFATGGVKRKLRNRQNRGRQKHYFLHQENQNHQNKK